MRCARKFSGFLKFLGGAALCALTLLWTPDTVLGATTIFSGPTGLSGKTVADLGDEVVIYTVALQKGDANEGLTAIRIEISDLTIPTGLVNTDFTELNLYRSTDAVWDVADALIFTVAPAGIVIGGVTSMNPNAPLTGGAGAVNYIFLTAVISPTATIGHSFKVGAPVNNIDIDSAPPVTGGAVDQQLDGFLASDDNNSIGMGQYTLEAPGYIAIPVGLEWAAGLGFWGYGTYWLLKRRRAARATGSGRG